MPSSPASSTVVLQVLGPPAVQRRAGDRATAVHLQPLRLAALTYLALARPRGKHARDALVAMFWPDADQAGGRHALRNCLHGIRQALGEGILVTAGDEFVGLDPALLECDVLALEDDLRLGRGEAALDRYTGELLAGFHVSDAPAFEQWLEAERGRLRDAVAAAAWSSSDARHAGGDLADAAALARRAHALAADDELSLRRLMQRLDEAGDRAGALRAFDEFARRMREEFDAAPSPGTMAVADRLRSRPAAMPARPLSQLAVLPFTDRTGLGDGAELSDGLTAGVASRLARLRRFHVTARSVVAGVRVPGADALAIGRAIGAEAIVTGVLASHAGRFQVRLEVVRVEDGRLLLGDAVGTDSAGLFMLEAHAATAICRALGATSSDELDLVAGGRPARHGEAHVLFVRGQYRFLRAAAGGHPAELEQAREHFEQALAMDPGFAPAVAGLSNYFAVAAARNVLRPFAPAFARAIALSREALTLDPAQAIPHVHLGVQALYLDDDWAEAERRFERALQLEPSYAEAHRFLAIHRALFGRHDESLAHHEEAVRLEPQIPTFRNSLAAAYLAQRRYDAAVRELRHALELDPQYWAARERLLRCLERLEAFEEAAAERQRDARAAGAAFASAYARGGADGYRAARADEIRSALQALAARLATDPDRDAGDRFNPPELRAALLHAELGEWDEALEWERRACRERPGRRLWFTSHPDLQPLADRRSAE